MPSQERLRRYQDFVQLHSTDGAYDPRKGLEGLLSVLSPDPKGMVLKAMGEEMYFSYRYLHAQIRLWLESLGIPGRIFPLIGPSIWSYCERRDKEGEVVDGSLVTIGAVVKQAVEQTPVGLRFGYMRSLAGQELALPIVQQGIEFVCRASTSSVQHNHDSLWRIIGNVGSPTDQRRLLPLYDVVDFLVHNPGEHRATDIYLEQVSRSRAYSAYTHVSKLGLTLSSLEDCGMINYQSGNKDVAGKQGTGWSKYILQRPERMKGIDRLYHQIKASREWFSYPTVLSGVVNYIKENPQGEYDSVTLGQKLRISERNTGYALSSLESVGVLKRLQPQFKSAVRETATSANDLTRMFYDLVCQPTKAVAETLISLPEKPWDRQKVALFINNYQEERSHEGPAGGQQVRDLLIIILSEHDELKLSHITDFYNSLSGRHLKHNSVQFQLKNLAKQGVVEQPRSGFYRLVPRPY